MNGNAFNVAKFAIGEVGETTLKKPTQRKSGLADTKARQESATEAQQEAIERVAANARCK
jgi:hypothetical protein